MSERTIVTKAAAEMTPRRVRWLWKDRLPRGMFSLLAGREGVGKSCLAIELAARVTKGELEGDQQGSPASVLFIAAEDSWEHTVIPRLMAAGADLARVHQVRVREGTNLDDLSLPSDIAALEAEIREREVRLIVIDPLISRLDDGLDTHKDRDVRRALEPLAGLAERTDAAVLGIIHVNKTDTADPLTSVMGSRAFTATARAVLYATGGDSNSEPNLLCFSKSNLGPKQRSLLYTVSGVDVGADPEDGRPITAGKVKWIGESDRTARDVLADEASRHRPPSALVLAKAWLREQLADGPVAAQELNTRAAVAGISAKTLDRAATALEVDRARRGYQGGSVWALPDDGTGQPAAGQAQPPPPQADTPHPRQPAPATTRGVNGRNDVNGARLPHSHQSRQPGGAAEGGAVGPGCPDSSLAPPRQAALTRRARQVLGWDTGEP